MPKGYLAAAALVDKHAKKASSFQRQLLASLPEGYLAPAVLLASMPKGYLAPASFADEYAQGLSRISFVCWRVCHKAISLQHLLLASMP